MSRTKNSLRNITVSFISQIILMGFSFVSRNIFIHTLGAQYLGISGLFTNIISMLSLAELGVGTAIIYNLYKPLAEKDEKRIAQFMNLYKIAYRIIGVAILLIGLLLIPFLPKIIKGDTSFFNISLVYIIFLLQSVTTYVFFAYKSSLARADQQEYVITGITTAVNFLTNIVQIVTLLTLHSFYLYILIVIVGNLLSNLLISIEVNRRYRYMKKNGKELPPKQEIKDVFHNCYALSIYKVNGVVLKSIDNIVLSKFIGLTIVGLYSNYTLVSSYLKNFLNIIFSGILASLGNLHVNQTGEREYQIFKIVNFITFWIFGIISIGIYVVVNPFIQIWLGKEYVLGETFIVVLSADFYLYGILKALSTFRTSMGLFKQAKYRPLFGAIINTVLSIALVGKYDVAGVVFATIIANLSTYFVFDSYIIFKNGLRRSVKEYYKIQSQYFAIIAVCGFIVKMIVSQITSNFAVFFTGGVLSILIPSAAIYVLYRKSKEWCIASELFSRTAGKILGKFREKLGATS